MYFKATPQKHPSLCNSVGERNKWNLPKCEGKRKLTVGLHKSGSSLGTIFRFLNVPHSSKQLYATINSIGISSILFRNMCSVSQTWMCFGTSKSSPERECRFSESNKSRETNCAQSPFRDERQAWEHHNNREVQGWQQHVVWVLSREKEESTSQNRWHHEERLLCGNIPAKHLENSQESKAWVQMVFQMGSDPKHSTLWLQTGWRTIKSMFWSGYQKLLISIL